MRDSFKPFFAANYKIQPGGPNGGLYSAEYQSIADPSDQLARLELECVAMVSSPFILGSTYSHDNADGYYCLMHMLEHEIPFQFGRFMLNPPNAIFYAWASGGVLGLLATPLLFISSIAMILSCLIPGSKTINGAQVLGTDGILLARLKFNTFNLPITKLICDFIIKKKYGGYQIIFDTFFGKEHPISVISREKGL